MCWGSLSFLPEKTRMDNFLLSRAHAAAARTERKYYARPAARHFLKPRSAYVRNNGAIYKNIYIHTNIQNSRVCVCFFFYFGNILTVHRPLNNQIISLFFRLIGSSSHRFVCITFKCERRNSANSPEFHVQWNPIAQRATTRLCNKS